MTEHYFGVRRISRGLGYPQTQRYVKRAIAATLDAEGVDVPCEVQIVLVDDATIREINREFRGIDRSTDVLSFPMSKQIPGAFDPDLCDYDYDYDCLHIGDMMISMERCAQQAEEFGHSFAHEVTYLAVHSTLHLLGYDHEDEGEQKKQMRTREKEILKLLGENE